ncbi:YolD-like family protein [Bacillus massiliigorillae]|uniref:YolD-like family protein n=1 Tax=Bacillus massiliigorillae TaxID=1243664 RepID=UPI00039D1E8D|nr:YolD-like family protein [Bacillus massiliigorillae]
MAYQDRGMMKWQGFVLSEHSEDISYHDRKKISPIILDEQTIEQFNEMLQESHEYHSPLKITSSNPNNLYDAIKYSIGYVWKYDAIKKGIVVKQEDGTQEFIAIDSIRHISEVN